MPDQVYWLRLRFLNSWPTIPEILKSRSGAENASFYPQLLSIVQALKCRVHIAALVAI